MFIYTIDPISFDYSILLNVSEEIFHRFNQKVAPIQVLYCQVCC